MSASDPVSYRPDAPIEQMKFLLLRRLSSPYIMMYKNKSARGQWTIDSLLFWGEFVLLRSYHIKLMVSLEDLLIQCKEDRDEGNFLLIYIWNFHVLSNLLLIYICKLNWMLFQKRKSNAILRSLWSTLPAWLMRVKWSFVPLTKRRIQFVSRSLLRTRS